MSASTGPILAAGGIVIFNNVVALGQPVNQQNRVIVGGLLAAGGLYLWEQAMPRTAVAVAWLALLATLIVRVNPATPAPIETFDAWYRK